MSLAPLVAASASSGGDGGGLGFKFTERGAAAGLTAITVFGGKDANRYLLETASVEAAAAHEQGFHSAPRKSARV